MTTRKTKISFYSSEPQILGWWHSLPPNTGSIAMNKMLMSALDPENDIDQRVNRIEQRVANLQQLEPRVRKIEQMIEQS